MTTRVYVGLILGLGLVGLAIAVAGMRILFEHVVLGPVLTLGGFLLLLLGPSIVGGFRRGGRDAPP